MVHNEWLNEGDQVITKGQSDYFDELVAFRLANEDLWKQFMSEK